MPAGSGIDDFRSGLAGNGIVELVLHHGIKLTGYRGIPVILQTAFGKNICNLLPDTAFTGPDGADPLQKFAEIVFAESRPPLLKTFIIHGKAFDHVFLKNAGGPDAELGGPPGIHPISHGDDGVEVIEFVFSSDLPGTFCLNYREILGSSIFIQFAVRNDIF